MKRNIVILLICMGIMMCTGCQRLPYVNEIPAAYDDTRWVSEEPYIWFECPSEGTSKYLYGKALTPDGEVDIAVDFATFKPEIYIYDVRTSMYAEEGDEEPETYIGFRMISGICVYSPNECRVVVKTDNWFEGEYETIVFKREPLE